MVCCRLGGWELLLAQRELRGLLLLLLLLLRHWSALQLLLLLLGGELGLLLLLLLLLLKKLLLLKTLLLGQLLLFGESALLGELVLAQLLGMLLLGVHLADLRCLSVDLHRCWLVVKVWLLLLLLGLFTGQSGWH